MGSRTRSVYFGCDGNRYVPSWWLATKQVSNTKIAKWFYFIIIMLILFYRGCKSEQM